MRYEIQEIIPGLFLGPYSCARDKDYLHRHGITHMLCVMDPTEKVLMRRRFPEEFQYCDLYVGFNTLPCNGFRTKERIFFGFAFTIERFPTPRCRISSLSSPWPNLSSLKLFHRGENASCTATMVFHGHRRLL
jgi:hypothetical protein